VSKLARRMARKGELYVIDLNGERRPAGTRSDVALGMKPLRVKSVDGFWQRKKVELAENHRTSVPAKHPLDRRIERAIKRATSKP
jgi:hypothetical protein